MDLIALIIVVGALTLSSSIIDEIIPLFPKREPEYVVAAK